MTHLEWDFSHTSRAFSAPVCILRNEDGTGNMHYGGRLYIVTGQIVQFKVFCYLNCIYLNIFIYLLLCNDYLIELIVSLCSVFLFHIMSHDVCVIKSFNKYKYTNMVRFTHFTEHIHTVLYTT